MKRYVLILALISFCGAIALQAVAPQKEAVGPSGANHPLPDLPTLFRDIVKHQKELDEIRKNYIFKESSREEELDSNGQIKKTTLEDKETFYVGRRSVSRLLRKDGRELTPDEQAKEQKRVDKEIADHKKREIKREEKGKDDDESIGVE